MERGGITLFMRQIPVFHVRRLFLAQVAPHQSWFIERLSHSHLFFYPWKKDQPGFVEMDLVAHRGTHLNGDFLYTLTITDIATGWTECLPLFSKCADEVLAAFVQVRRSFPFPLLGLHTDGGS